MDLIIAARLVGDTNARLVAYRRQRHVVGELTVCAAALFVVAALTGLLVAIPVGAAFCMMAYRLGGGCRRAQGVRLSTAASQARSAYWEIRGHDGRTA